jgi:hypothetical protein
MDARVGFSVMPAAGRVKPIRSRTQIMSFFQLRINDLFGASNDLHNAGNDVHNVRNDVHGAANDLRSSFIDKPPQPVG